MLETQDASGQPVGDEGKGQQSPEQWIPLLAPALPLSIAWMASAI